MTEKEYKRYAANTAKTRKKPGEVWSGFTWADYANACDYLLAAQRMLRLEHWKIEIAERSLNEDKGEAARIFPTYGTHYAVLSFSEIWNEFPEAKKRKTIAHELAHLIVERAWNLAFEISKEYLAPAIHGVYALAIKEAIETAIDDIAENFATMLDDYPEPAPEPDDDRSDHHDKPAKRAIVRRSAKRRAGNRKRRKGSGG
jgi:hypothetical protein